MVQIVIVSVDLTVRHITVMIEVDGYVWITGMVETALCIVLGEETIVKDTSRVKMMEGKFAYKIGMDRIVQYIVERIILIDVMLKGRWYANQEVLGRIAHKLMNAQKVNDI